MRGKKDSVRIDKAQIELGVDALVKKGFVILSRTKKYSTTTVILKRGNQTVGFRYTINGWLTVF